MGVDLEPGNCLFVCGEHNNFLLFVNLRIINPHRVSLLCWWHYQLAVTFNNERVNIIFEAVKSSFISPREILVQHLMKSRSESLCVCPAYAGPVQTFQNIQIFSLCLTGLRLAYQTSCRWNMWLLLYSPPLYRCMNRDLPCVEEKGLSAHSLYYNQSGSPSLWMKMFKDQLYWNWGDVEKQNHWKQ